MMNDNNYTTTTTCDECGAKAPGVMLHQAGAPVMFICKNCDGKMYERQARQDINAWLEGGEPFAARM
jgi:hypothetical protein